MVETKSFLRQWLILRTLSARGLGRTFQSLADEFGTNERTIRRDFEALRDVGFRFSETTGPHNQKTWKLDTDSILNGLVFTFEEVTALYLGRRFLDPLANTVIWEAAQKAFRKMRAGFGNERIQYLEKLATAFHQTAIGESDYSQHSEVIDLLMLSSEESTAVELTYHSVKRDSDRTVIVEPYGIIYHRSRLYLVAYAREHAEIRHYKIDRVTNVNILDADHFERPADFDLQTHLTNTFGVYHSDTPPVEVRIRFNQQAASYIKEHRWHSSQSIQENLDGSLLVTMQLSELEEVKAWVLSFGAKAVVEAPDALRLLMLKEARQMLKQMEEHS